MTKEKFEKSGWKMTFDEINKCDCPNIKWLVAVYGIIY